MATSPDSTRSKYDLAATAVRLAELGDLEAAEAAFQVAIEADPRNLDLHFNLAIVLERLGEIDGAAGILCSILVKKPAHGAAAARLSRLLARYEVSDLVHLHPGGLKAAMQVAGVAHQPIVDATFAWLLEFDDTLQDGAARIAGGAEERAVARPLVAPRVDATLSAGLLLLCLRQGILKNPALERLLTGVRAAVLLDCPAARFTDRDLVEVVLALIQQGWHNDHAWAETADEIAALADLKIDRAALSKGDPAATWALLQAAMYRPLGQLVSPPLTVAEARQLKPRSVREALAAHVEERSRQTEAGARIPSLRPLVDATSLKVAGQYEAAPYPRWSSLHVSPAGSLKAALGGYFSSGELAFMDADFDVLIAGCGTGQQALQSAAAYGRQARVTALDLSRASLGYASDMAARNAIDTVAFVHGDILDADRLDRDFDIIECVGVLHHMADWRAGWHALLARLKPAGLMYVGLYSAVSRSNLLAVRAEPASPAPGCADEHARAWRRELMLRADDAPGGACKISRDFHALNAFRDLVLHESEAHVTLEEIAAFLDQQGLEFRGFTLERGVWEDFAAAYPGSAKPGQLADWATFERAHPRTFDGMYRFWLSRRN